LKVIVDAEEAGRQRVGMQACRNPLFVVTCWPGELSSKEACTLATQALPAAEKAGCLEGQPASGREELRTGLPTAGKTRQRMSLPTALRRGGLPAAGAPGRETGAPLGLLATDKAAWRRPWTPAWGVPESPAWVALGSGGMSPAEGA
jgi:hypothetical protein